MDGLQIKLFGELSIQYQGVPLAPPTGKALELFCYLLLNQNRSHTREILSEVLWPGGKPAVSRRYLRQALWRLSTAMRYRQDSHREETELLLIGEHGWVRLNPDVSWWLDVSEFERAYTATRDLTGQSLFDHQAHNLEAAVDLYRGDLLATWYQDWCCQERDRLQLVYLAMLDQLMGYCETRQLYGKGVSLGQLVLRYDPARECAHRQLMRLHYRAGDRISALRQYERCASIMNHDLGIQPSGETVALYEQIRVDRVVDIPLHTAAGRIVPPVAEPPSPEWQATTVLADLRARLDQIQASLLTLQQSVLQDHGRRLARARTTPNGSPEQPNGLLE